MMTKPYLYHLLRKTDKKGRKKRSPAYVKYILILETAACIGSAWDINWAPNLLAPGWFFVGFYLCSGYMCGSGHTRLGTLGSVARSLSASVSQLQTKSQMSFKLL